MFQMLFDRIQRHRLLLLFEASETCTMGRDTSHGNLGQNA